MSKTRKSPYYVVINLLNPKESDIYRSIVSVSALVKMHRNSIDKENDGIYNHYLVLPRYIK